MSLTTKLREYRARDKLSQEELAQKVGVRRETIGNLENGRYNPSLKLAMDSANVYGCTVEELSQFHCQSGGASQPRKHTEPGVCCCRRPAHFLICDQALAAAGKVIPPTLTFTAAISRPVMDSTAVFTASCTALPTSGMVWP